MALLIDNEHDHPLPLDVMERIAKQYSERDIELLIVDDETIQHINAEHRGYDKPTDVLSFPMEDMPFAPLGSMVISYDHVRQGAKTFGHTPDDELLLLFIHGLLHLVGYDHECDEGDMRQEEEKLIAQLGLPASLIVRSQED